MSNKNLLRKKYIRIRNFINDKDFKSLIIYKKIVELEEYKNARKVALYSSFGSEVDTLKLIRKALLNKEVYLPRIVNDTDMEFYKIESVDDVSYKNKYGILEPAVNKNMVLDKSLLDIIIVPGICFDISKNRVGYGKGYYDKYLSDLSAFKLGICFDEQILNGELIDTNSFDSNMDLIITDKRLVK